MYKGLDTSVLPCPSAPSEAAPSKTKKQQSNDEKKTKTAAQKRRSVVASPAFELVHTHDYGSFMQRLTRSTRCLQIALFLMDFIFDAEATDEVRSALYFSMFADC